MHTQSLAGTPIALSREQLYQQVWSTPMRTLAPRYGLSDVGLAKICKRHMIPRPPVGYWSKRAHGKNVPRQPLPPIDEITPTVIRLVEVKDPKPRKPEPREPIDPAVIRLIERFEGGRLAVASDPGRIESPLAIDARASLLRKDAADNREKERGFVATAPIKSKPRFRVRVGQGSVDRAAVILDALVRGLADRGVDLEGWTAAAGTKVPSFVLRDERFTIELTEKRRQVPHELTDDENELLKEWGSGWGIPKFDFVPSGVLHLSISHVELYTGYGWNDTPTRPLERQIPKAIGKLPWLVDLADRTRIQRAQEEIDRAERARLAEERRAREADEARRRWVAERQIEELNGQAERWGAAERLRSFADAAERRGVCPVGDCDLASWLTWARSYADRVDPLGRVPSPRGGA